MLHLPGWGDQNFNDCQEGEAVTKPEVNVSGVLKQELKKQPPSHLLENRKTG